MMFEDMKAKRNVILTLLLSCLTTHFLFAQTEIQRRPMTTDDGLDMVQVSGALLSPDGNMVFYQESRLNWEKNKRENKYYMITAEGGEAFQYLGESGGSDFQFSPKGTYLSFKRSVGEKDKKAQLFLMRTSGGEAVQLTKHKAGVGSYKWAKDEQTIFFVANEARSEEEEKEYKNGNDAFFVDEGSNGQTAAQWRNLWAFDV